MKNEIKYAIGAAFITFCATALLMSNEDRPVETNTNTSVVEVDSLKDVISNLEIELNNEREKWDNVEKNYRTTIFEYEYGINGIKETHPDAYKEFHRIISLKEEYNRVDEIENKKRLKASL